MFSFVMPVLLLSLVFLNVWTLHLCQIIDKKRRHDDGYVINKLRTSRQLAVTLIEVLFSSTEDNDTKLNSYNVRPTSCFYINADKTPLQVDLTIIVGYIDAYPNSRWIAMGAAILSAHTGSSGGGVGSDVCRSVFFTIWVRGGLIWSENSNMSG